MGALPLKNTACTLGLLELKVQREFYFLETEIIYAGNHRDDRV